MAASGTMPPQAMPAPVPPAPPGTVVHEPSAFDTIAEEFIRQYFTFLQNRPSALACFYKDSSIYTVTEAPGYVNGRAGMRPVGHNAVVVQGAANIGAKIREHLFHEVPSEEEAQAPHTRRTSCQVKDLTWMHQVSLNGSLVLQVVGRQVNLETLQYRRFMQTFVLACEPGQSNNYFVNNDLCNYFELENPPPPMMAPGHMHMVNGPNGPVPMGVPSGLPGHGQGLVPVSPPGAKPQATPSSPVMAAAVPAPAEKSPSGSPTFGSLDSPAPAQEEQQTADEQEFHLPAPTIPPSAIPATPEDVEEDAPEAEMAPRVEAIKLEDKEDVAEEAEVADGDGSGPKVMSWAALTAKHKPPAAVPQQSKPLRKNGPASTSPAEEEENKEDVVAKEAEDTAAPPPRKERAPYKPPESIELEASVFVSGVPQSCNEDKLKALFGKHGDVVKVSLKAEKHFAIIDFSAPDAALDALKFPTVKHDGAILKVEKRRAGGAKPSRTKGGEGRGGERARGRGRESGGRGGGRRGPREQ